MPLLAWDDDETGDSSPPPVLPPAKSHIEFVASASAFSYLKYFGPDIDDDLVFIVPPKRRN